MEKSNIVTQNELRKIQLKTMERLAEVLMNTAGPFGSNTLVLHDNRYNEYTKDGYKVLSNIQYYDPLEKSIKEELTEVTRYIVKTVGDGTTSAVLLSYSIFKELCNLQNKGYRPYELITTFKSAVEDIKKEIESNGRKAELDDIYNIALISTNGNESIANDLKTIYDIHGMDVFIDVGTSGTTETIMKEYDGLTLETGFASPAYINNEKGTCTIRNPRIYTFEDPIDTKEMMSLFATIISSNIMQPVYSNNYENMIPTVIIAPSISRDFDSSLAELENLMYKYDNNKNNKPPLLIITNIGKTRLEIYDDIARLCGCKPIKKYINPDVQKAEIEKGNAPTIETILDWCGTADEVVADDIITKFVNPIKMFDVNENGERTGYSDIYNGLIKFLESNLTVAYNNNEDASVTGNLKRRLNSLKANMVDYLIGGVTSVDRDSLRDLVEDAVLNCRSAAKKGVGYGANYEGLRASYKVMNRLDKNIDDTMIKLIYEAYKLLSINLYSTAMVRQKAECAVEDSLEIGCPINLTNLKFDKKVLSTIDSDIVILDVVSKIITIMYTANQALLVSPLNNIYHSEDE